METTKALYTPSWVIKNKYGDLYLDQHGDILYFTTRDESLFFVKSMFDPTTWHTEMYINDTWKDRETHFLLSNPSIRPLWYKSDWYNKQDGTYCRINMSEKKSVLYIASPEHGMQGIYTPSTPGKYLTKYYGDRLESYEIQDWADKHREVYDNRDIVVQWANTPDEIEQVYSMDKTFESCMQKSKSYFYPKIHPARVYGAGDLSVAYLTTATGKLKARALVWKEKQKVSRVYGDSHTLRAALLNAGIKTKSTSDDYDSISGAKILKIKDSSNKYVLPYIDGAPHFTESIDDKHFILKENSAKATHSCKGAGGYGTEFPLCFICNARIDNVTQYSNVLSIDYNTGSLIHISLCTNHAGNIKTLPASSQKYYLFDGTIGIKEDSEYGITSAGINNAPVLRWVPFPTELLHYFNIFKSSVDDKYYVNNEVVVVYDKNKNYQHWHRSQATEDKVFMSEYSGIYYTIENKIKVGLENWSKTELEFAWKSPDNDYYINEHEYKIIQDLEKHDLFGVKVYDFNFDKRVDEAYDRDYSSDNWVLRSEFNSWPLVKILASGNVFGSDTLRFSFYNYISHHKRNYTIQPTANNRDEIDSILYDMEDRDD